MKAPPQVLSLVTHEPPWTITREDTLAMLPRLAGGGEGAARFRGTVERSRIERRLVETPLAELERSRALLPQVATEVAIGNAHLFAGDADAAAAACQRALRLDPGSFRAHANLAVALRRLGRDDDAELHLRAARRIWPYHPVLAAIAAQPGTVD